MKKVCILISTYNGEVFLREQLDSLFQQTYSDLSVFVRDDGSTDSTLQLLHEYAEKYPNLHYYTGENLKPAHSFLDLMKHAPKSDYYALCDQDDVWMPDKISVAINMLNSHHADLYYSSYTTVDKDMTILEKNIQKPVMRTLGQAMVFASVTGCTMVFTNRLLEMVNSYLPPKIMMHDSWIYKIALAMECNICYDEKSHILYRQHGNNVIGSHKSRLQIWEERIERILKNRRLRYDESESLYMGYAHLLSPRQLQYLEPMIGYYKKNIWKRLRIAFSNNYHTNILNKDVLFKIAILCKRY